MCMYLCLHVYTVYVLYMCLRVLIYIHTFFFCFFRANLPNLSPGAAIKVTNCSRGPEPVSIIFCMFLKFNSTSPRAALGAESAVKRRHPANADSLLPRRLAGNVCIVIQKHCDSPAPSAYQAAKCCGEIPD